MKKVFIIEYKMYDARGKLKQTGKSRVRNRTNNFSAMISLEDHLKRQHLNFGKLEIISCKLDHLASAAIGAMV